MTSPLLTSVVVTLYLALTLYLVFCVKRQARPNKPLLFALGMIAVCLQLFTLVGHLFTPEGFSLGSFDAGSLIMAAVLLFTLLTALFIPVENLLLLLFPLTAFIALLSELIPSGTTATINESPGVLCHILLSILAYGMLTIAVFQALLLSLQNYLLRRKRLSGIIRSFPPLETMESLLFCFLWSGWLLLTASLFSGWLAFENLFAQHLGHKTALGCIAWIVFGGLLAGRHFLGWRGIKAIHWTYAGFCLLMLAYFGSKLVREFILAT